MNISNKLSIWRYPKTIWKESRVVKWIKPGHCENKPKNVKMSKNIKRWNSHTLLIKALSIKITYIMHIWLVHECINQFLTLKDCKSLIILFRLRIYLQKFETLTQWRPFGSGTVTTSFNNLELGWLSSNPNLPLRSKRSANWGNAACISLTWTEGSSYVFK